MELKDKSVIVTGGSRGLGLGLVETLLGRAAKVTVVARASEALTAVAARPGVTVIAADVTDEQAAHRILGDVRPDVLALIAGQAPRMGRLDELSWTDFTAPWESDVRAGFHWVQAALRTPLAKGSRVLIGSSGAAQGGSVLSGGYAGAKRMLWFMAKYANDVSSQRDLGIVFQAVLPMQMVAGTGTGDAASAAYGRALGVTPAEFLARFGVPMPPADFGEKVVSLLEDPDYAQGLAFGLKGETGITVLEEIAA